MVEKRILPGHFFYLVVFFQLKSSILGGNYCSEDRSCINILNLLLWLIIMTINFLNKFIPTLLLKEMLLMNLACSFPVKGSGQSMRFQEVLLKIKTLSETGKTSIDRTCLLCCTVEKDVNTFTVHLHIPPGHSVCLVIVPCLDRVVFFFFFSVTVFSCLKCFYPCDPLHKQVNNILGFSSAFCKE